MTKSPKERVDLLLVERGLVETREQAKRSIMAGIVFSNEIRLEKPGEKIAIDAPLQVKGSTMKYVSRGGLKLEKAIDLFELDLSNQLVLDIGASTGGFTDCALQSGAAHCYALDVGYNQLSWKLRNHSQVTVMERTNFRYVTAADLEKGMPTFATIDVSFISLKLILPVLKTLLVPGGEIVALIKPQFEAGRELVGKKGIVREPKTHLLVLREIIAFMETLFEVKGLTYSPITGGEGNIEFLAYLQNNPTSNTPDRLDKLIEQTVRDAHETLKEK
ncbi:TlyA family RNA methyltransferase [Paenisporosarcina cavernae]|uniref:TlyA family RNA methyltransferase n=1 Tax=Paenisporosarcina cavernae TaxID=2320858 RepID=A0A385YV16_9BACL|nr:TlyA family RNA methyltransferase [Paenisporosarcina cavernae]AYC29538.1 TlyA family RNA methyltransferase [Paenisporosarcina cavernae]